MSLEIKKHSDLSASASDRWLNCAPSVWLSKEAPPPVESKYAVEGTLAHHYLEEWLLSHWYGVKYKIPKELKSNPEMLEAVSLAVRYVTEIWDEDTQKLFIEEKVSLEFIHPDMFGTGDVFIVEPGKTLRVIDYKHGKGKAVDVSYEGTFSTHYNTQLMYYAIGMAHRYDYNFKEIVLTIIQPRASHSDGPIREVTVRKKDLKEYIYLLTRGVDRVVNKKGSLAQGQWCYWCPAREHNCKLHDRLKYERSKELLDSF